MSNIRGQNWDSTPDTTPTTVAMKVAINMMRQVMMACGGVTLDQVDRYAEAFTRTVIGTYLGELERQNQLHAVARWDLKLMQPTTYAEDDTH